MKTIRRYPNRLLYDSEVSRFVTGDDLRSYVRRGQPFRVVESRSGEDQTVSVLSQVFIEDLSTNQNHKSVIDILRGFIALGGEFQMDILKKTVLASIGMFEITKSKAEEIIDTLIKQGEIAKSKRSEAILELLDRAEQSTKGLKDKVAADIETTIDKMKVAKKKDLEDLSKKVEELAEQIRKLTEKL